MLDILKPAQGPVGTADEVRKMGRSPRMVASCEPQSEEVKGCPHYVTCEFREWRDRMNGKEGPCNCAVLMISGATGAADVREMACHEYMNYPHRMRAQSDQTGDVYEIIALEGEKYQTRGTRKKHMKLDPSCPECSQGKCNERVQVEIDMTVRPFRRPVDAAPALSFAEKMKARIRTQVQSERKAKALGMQEEEGVKVVGVNIDDLKASKGK